MTTASADPAALSSRFQTLGIGIWVGMVCWAAPTARLTMASETVTIEPYWPSAQWLIPTYEFAWADVRHVVVIHGLLGWVRGLQFVLRTPARATQRRGLGYLWPRQTQRPRVYLWPTSGDNAVAAIPITVPSARACRDRVAVTCAVASAAPSLGRSAVRVDPRTPALSFHPRFRVVAGAGQLTRADGRYALIFQDSLRDRGTIIDEKTGHTTRVIPQSGCDLAPVITPVGGPWVLAGCGTTQTGTPDEVSYELYNIGTGTWRPLMPNLTALEAGNPSSATRRLKGSQTSHLSGRDSGLSDYVLDCPFERSP